MYLLKGYDDAVQEILDTGVNRTNKRTGIKTLSKFGVLTRYRLDTEYFPIVTRRRVWPQSVFAELLWFISGSTNNEDLKKLGCNFWTPWVNDEFEKKHGYAPGCFGPVYGFQLRHFGGHYGNGIGGEAHTLDRSVKIECNSGGAVWEEDDGSIYGSGGFDQLSWVINRIKEDHSCRRTLWTLWNPKDVEGMRLPPCHLLYQVLVDDDRKLTGIMYQRSCDTIIGIPANIQFYSALTIMIAQQTECQASEFVHVMADAHLYEDQLEGVRQYLATPVIDSPKLSIHKASDILSYSLDDFVLTDFSPGPKINIPVAV